MNSIISKISSKLNNALNKAMWIALGPVIKLKLKHAKTVNYLGLNR